MECRMMDPKTIDACRRLVLQTSISMCFIPTAWAHDFWVEPSRFTSEVGETLTFSILVGENLEGQEFVRHPRHLVAFDLHDAQKPDAKPHPIPGRIGQSPVGYHRFLTAGRFIASYRSTFSSVTLEPERFNRYLNEESLTEIV